MKANSRKELMKSFLFNNNEEFLLKENKGCNNKKTGVNFGFEPIVMSILSDSSETSITLPIHNTFCISGLI